MRLLVSGCKSWLSVRAGRSDRTYAVDTCLTVVATVLVVTGWAIFR